MTEQHTAIADSQTYRKYNSGPQVNVDMLLPFKEASSNSHDDTRYHVVLDETAERSAILWNKVLVTSGD